MSNQFATTWTEDRVALLREIHAQGSNAWIARVINERTGSQFSRNAVIGKRMREGIGANAKPGQRIGNQITPRPRRRRSTGLRAQNGWRLPPDFSTFEDMPEAEFLNVPLLGLTANQCRYARGGGGDEPYLFCGQPTKKESSYCPHHHARVWVMPKRQQADTWQPIGNVVSELIEKLKASEEAA